MWTAMTSTTSTAAARCCRPASRWRPARTRRTGRWTHGRRWPRGAGDVSPWAGMAAAIGRTTRSGVLLGGAERVGAPRALELFLGPLDDPGGPPRTVAVGAPADLVLLDAPLDRALADPSADHVAA